MLGSYKNFSKEDLILRDYLAIDRTILSNESTLLAYVRTALAIIAAGATLIHFFEEMLVQTAGGVLVIMGIFILILGYRRFKIMQKSISEIRRS